MKDVIIKEPKKRLEICKKCPNIRRLDMCSICGCFMRLKTKLAWTKCPDKPRRW